jgi:hypothetical protein
MAYSLLVNIIDRLIEKKLLGTSHLSNSQYPRQSKYCFLSSGKRFDCSFSVRVTNSDIKFKLVSRSFLWLEVKCERDNLGQKIVHVFCEKGERVFQNLDHNFLTEDAIEICKELFFFFKLFDLSLEFFELYDEIIYTS